MNSLRCVLIAIAALLGGCASTQVVDARPGFTPSASDSDEAGMWFQMRKAELTLAQAPERVRDPALQKYLDELTCKLAEDLCPDIRVYLMRQPYLNAFMAPNGMMVLFTGTLLRAENEAQLAFVISHEIGHFRSRHSLENWRHTKNTANVLAGIGVIAGGSAVGIAALFGAYANLASFSREQEREADSLGFSRLSALDYDAQAPAQLWGAALAEEKANPRGFLSAVFASHPATEERRDRLQALAGNARGSTEVERYRKVTAGMRGAWLADELARRNYAQSEVLLARLESMRWDQARVRGFQGELYRKRAQAGDLPRAVAAYQSALRDPGAAPEIWRDLGVTLRRLNQQSDAKRAFAEYLERVPDADDAAMIRSYLDEK